MDPEASNTKVTVRRQIEASAEELFDAWLDPASLALWMCPDGIARSTAKVEAYVGGTFEILMISAEESFLHTGVYKVIDRPRLLVFTWISAATKQKETLVTVEFRAGDQTTEVIVTHEQLPDKDAIPSHRDGWSRALELRELKLAARTT